MQSKKLSSEERLEFFDTIFDIFFNEKTLDYSKIKSEKVSIILSCISPEIRKIQAKYDSGKATKKIKNNRIKMQKITKNLDTFFCKNSESETEQVLPNEIKISSDNIKFNNNNIINNQIRLSDEENDIKLILNNFNIDFSKLKNLLGDYFNWFYDSIKFLNYQTNLVISGKTIPAKSVLSKILNMASDERFYTNIFEKYKTLEQLGVPKTKIKYQISSLYNLALEIENVSEKSSGSIKNFLSTNYSAKPSTEPNSEIFTHNYTKEQLKNVFDDLDLVEI